ncbi:hypothetical protein M899_1361 [Bacteriovorax sp. BSW11_IV]|uniref:hypothetical protein n=1 Tax=Bacteriovorax sp. BSW11_IV TaxID=1353529 RepID=UPI00038A350C|nr:hypothetical protein [Bacteriovorax sp. BSW11_IV]EQC45903.1 hypothetical protein M899_1361 [Bacteriovorax sp. BSW11_IV]
MGGLSKLKDLFLSSKTETKKAAQNATSIEEVEKNKRDVQQNIRDKAQIEQYKKLIEDKLHDPEMTKKAALIISKMLEEKSNKKAS